MIRRFLLSLAFCLAVAGSLLGQITVPAEVEVHTPIVATSQSQADGYIWRVSSPAVRRSVDGGKTVHIWAPAGSYSIELVTTRLVIDWEARTFNFVQEEHVASFSVKGTSPPPGPDPPTPGPGPGPTPNPYRPAPEFQAAVEPVKSFVLSQPNSEKLAEMYATVASQARAGVFGSLGEVRADLVKRGTALNLKGVYPGLAEAVDKYLSACLGLEVAVPTARVGDTLETLAWAVFEAGRAR